MLKIIVSFGSNLPKCTTDLVDNCHTYKIPSETGDSHRATWSDSDSGNELQYKVHAHDQYAPHVCIWNQAQVA